MSLALMTPYAQAQVPEPGLAAKERQRLLDYSPLVKRIVHQLHAQVGPTMGRDDMEQIGLIGLLEALRRYGAPDERFGAFAAMRIRGAILDELRRQDWRPRAVRQDSHRTRDALREMTRRLGRPPAEAEILRELGMNNDAYHAYLLAENAEQLAGFDESVVELSVQASPQLGPEARLILRRTIEQALGVLDAREQRVIQLYYEFDLNFKEIAAVLVITEARVCQINKGALRKMKDFLRKY